MLFVGVDLTDPYAMHPRQVTQAILTNSLEIAFKEWAYEASGSGLKTSQEDEILAIDGPQGLARPGSTMRQCERTLGTPGKTPDALPVAGSKPFAGYVRGSVELFRELVHQFTLASDPDDRSSRLLEVYPGGAWPLLSKIQFARKTTVQGRQQRKAVLELRGLEFPNHLPSHDELDAAVAAYIAWCFHRGTAVAIGIKPFFDNDFLREGYIFQPPSLS